jgi:hypothetical protein
VAVAVTVWQCGSSSDSVAVVVRWQCVAVVVTVGMTVAVVVAGWQYIDDNMEKSLKNKIRLASHTIVDECET